MVRTKRNYTLLDIPLQGAQTNHILNSDYNFEPLTDGSCGLVPGLPPPDHSLLCTEDPSAVEFFEPTGYRRIPLTTCQGGRELDHSVSHPCPNHEDQYERRHSGLGGFAIFVIIIVCLGAAGAAGYWVWSQGIVGRQFGQIRLGESMGGSGGSAFERDSPLVTIPVAIVAGAVAVAKALPLLGMSLWRSARGYVPVGGGSGGGGRFGGVGRGSQQPYASRGAFAARRGEYVGVVEDEDELLGDDLDEDGEEV